MTMINAARPMTATRSAQAPKAAAPAQAPVQAPVAKKPVVAPVQAQAWTAGRIAKNAGVAVAGFTAGGVGTVVADLFFHFGNNGGTAWPGGIYLAAAGVVAAIAIGLYNRSK